MQRRLLAGLLAVVLLAAVSDRALRLRDEGLAQLENEQPARAEEIFQRLIEETPGDPLGYANLAIALLRQQKNDEALEQIDRALAKAPGRGDLLAIKGEILKWSGRPDEALQVLLEAARAAHQDPRVFYTLYRHALTLPQSEAEEAARQALEGLARLRPENVVVLLQLGARALAAAERAAATRAFLRIRELLWQAPPITQTALEQVLSTLEAGDLEAARIPSLRLENVLKVTPMYQHSLAELSPGIQGAPVERFQEEPPPEDFGSPVAVTFASRRLHSSPTMKRALVAADLDGDQRQDLARLVAADPPRLEIRRAARSFQPETVAAAVGLQGLVSADLDNDGYLDLLAFGPQKVLVWRGGDQGLQATDAFGLGAATATAAVAWDFDVEGDLDLVLGGGRSQSLELYRNALDGPLESVGPAAFAEVKVGRVRDLLASDLDRDGDLDLLLVEDGGVRWLANLRQGRFAARGKNTGLSGAKARRAISADLDNDGWPELILAGPGLAVWANHGGRFQPALTQPRLPQGFAVEDLAAFDADNDGRLDLVVVGQGGVEVLAQRTDSGFEALEVNNGPDEASAVAVADLDGDGDQDLAVGGAAGLLRLENRGGNRNHWLDVRLRGLDKGNSKNNLFGLGAVLEVRAGRAYQFREVHRDVTHFGLGKLRQAEVLRVVWTNGVPQNRLAVDGNQLVVEEQVLKGSCPFLYAWNGNEIVFVTDLLWGSPLGLPVAPGVWASADPTELVLVEGARPRDGIYDLRITEELWEAAFFDYLALWVVDHPADVEVASALRIRPGHSTPERVLASRRLRPVAAAWDGQGLDVTQRLRRRDDIYADGYEPSAYQGVAEDPWSLTFDLGEAPAAPVRLHLDGWVFPTDASLNLALAQRSDLTLVPPRLEVETGQGWQILVDPMGFPAGKTKTLVVDTPSLPAGSRRLRIVTTMWLSWDRVAWTTEPTDEAALVRAKLLPSRADLHYRGFSALVRQAPNAPHTFDYRRTDRHGPWLPLAGNYTRFGDVRELLRFADDRSAILAAGDELAVTFDATGLPPPPAGWRRTVLLESHGWDKDADRNTWKADRLEPLPFRAMSGYPYTADEGFPDTALYRDYRRHWLTRSVAPETGNSPQPDS